MESRRLGTYSLPPTETALIQALLRLYGGQVSRWKLVSTPPYDALIIDDALPQPEQKKAGELATAILRLTRMKVNTDGNALQRPVRAEDLFNWLRETERQDASPPAAWAGKSSSGQTKITPAATVQTQRRPAAGLQARPRAAGGDSQARYKLHRWPPQIMLRGDPHRLRMATMLSRRHLSTEELATVSGQSTDDARLFLQLLLNTGLVRKEEDRPPRRASDTSRQGARPSYAAPTVKHGLISSIRRRLKKLGLKSSGAVHD